MPERTYTSPRTWDLANASVARGMDEIIQHSTDQDLKSFCNAVSNLPTFSPQQLGALTGKLPSRKRRSTLRGTRIRSYAEAVAFLNGRRKRKLCNNTIIFQEKPDAQVEIWHHDTDIITYWPGGSITLRNDGWYSSTTRERLNRFSPYTVYSQRTRPGYLSREEESWAVVGEHDSATFKDGMTSDRDGRWQTFKARTFERQKLADQDYMSWLHALEFSARKQREQEERQRREEEETVTILL